MKKFLFASASALLIASVVYAGPNTPSAKIIINNELAAKNVQQGPWVNVLDLRVHIAKGKRWSTNALALPNGNNVISNGWADFDFLSAEIDAINGGYIGNDEQEHDFMASPSCKNIKIMPHVTNRIDVTSGTISVLGVKTPGTICTVSYSGQE